MDHVAYGKGPVASINGYMGPVARSTVNAAL